MNPILIGAIGGGLTGTLVDLRAFSNARKTDRTATFDFVLAFTNFLIGAIVGGTTAAGLGGLNL